MTTGREIPDRIQWHEGMLLAPQHFQQESARVDALVTWHALAANPYGWGVRRMVVDEALLGAGLLRIVELDAVMPGGTAVVYNVREGLGAPLELDLKALGVDLEQGSQPFFLCLGQRRSVHVPTGQAGASAGAAAQPHRFVGVETVPVEDEVSQAVATDVPRMRLNLSLAVGARPSSVFESMRLGTVLKDNQVYRLGPSLPPTLELQPDSELIVRTSGLAGQVRNKAAFLAKQGSPASPSIEDRLAFMELRQRLALLVTPLPMLEAVLRSPHIHPYSLFLALSSMLGPMALLNPGSVPVLPPPWAHDDPAACIDVLLEALEDSVQAVSQEYRTQPFGYTDGAFALELSPEWMTPSLVLGIRAASAADAAAWMQGAIIGSKVVWTTLSDRRVLGAPRRQVSEAADIGVRGSSDYTLFRVEVTDEFIVPEQPLVVRNPNEGRASARPMELVLFIRG